MTTLAIGASVSLTLAKNGFLEIATNGGLGSVSITPTGGALVTAAWGPEPVRKRWQGYPEGAAVVLSNLTAPSVDYESDFSGLPNDGLGVSAESWMSEAIAALIGVGPTRIYHDDEPLLIDDEPIFHTPD